MSTESHNGVAQPSSKPEKIAPLTVVELARVATDLQTLVGAQLQEVLQTPSEIGLGFYHQQEMLWLWFDLHPQRPLIVRFRVKPPQRKKLMRPLTLFVRSRFLGRRLSYVRADLARGRILLFGFHRAADEGTVDLCEIEVRLFPHGQNVIARDGDKSIAENKPKDLVAPQQAFSGEDAGRPWEEIEEQWRALQRKSAPTVQAAVKDAAALEREYKRAIEKKEKALERMHEELRAKTSTVYAEVGEWLKTYGTVEIPGDWPDEKRDLIDAGKSLSWNIEEVFRKGKDNARKSEGTRARLAQVEKELSALKAQGPAAFDRGRDRTAKIEAQNLLSKADARGRRHKVAEDLEMYVGKSAADNLALLRRAQAFDYWLHLRDYPGSHAILRRTRGRTVTDAEFYEAGKFVVEQSLGKRVTELKGERLDMLIVECRFVRPIKGDKLGRVNYTNDRVLTLKY